MEDLAVFLNARCTSSFLHGKLKLEGVHICTFRTFEELWFFERPLSQAHFRFCVAIWLPSSVGVSWNEFKSLMIYSKLKTAYFIYGLHYNEPLERVSTLLVVLRTNWY